MSKKFNYIALGGTFDRLHKGHISIIDFAFKISNKVIIGITADFFNKNKSLLKQILPYETRKKEIEKYLDQNNFTSRVKIIPLFNICGSAADDNKLEAIVVTKETQKNALKINTLRINKGLKPLSIVNLPLIKSADKKVIRSSRIRQGLIDRQGYIFSKIFKDRKNLLMPESLRETLKTPFGIVIKGKKAESRTVALKAQKYIMKTNPSLIIAVGDIVAKSFETIGFKQDLSVVDFRSERTDLSKQFKIKGIKHINKAGTLNYKTGMKFKSIFNNLLKNNKRYSMVIKGEEDLLALPAILFAPLGSVVVYGLRNSGVVVVEVDEVIKKRVKKIIEEFNLK